MNELCFFSNISSSEWAAWVQAIGSVAAILSAIWIMHLQHKHGEILAKREALRRLESVRAVVLHTALGVKTAIDAIAAETEAKMTLTLKVHRDKMSYVNGPIQAIPLHELGSFELVSRVFEIDRLGRRVETNIAALQRKAESNTLNMEEVKSVMETHSNAFLNSKAAFEAAVTALQKKLS